MKKILIGYPLKRYRELTDIIHSLSTAYKVVMRDYDYGWLKKNICRFEILIPNLKVIINDDIISRANRLKLIFSPTTGTDHIRIAKKKTGITVVTLNDFRDEIASISSTAELGFALVLALSRKINLAHKDVVRYGRWERNRFVGNQLQNKVLGIVGMGRIGRKIAQYAKAFGMKIQYWDKVSCKQWKKAKRLNGLLSSSDFIVMATSLNNSTHYLINKDNVGFIKKGAVLVNISRGGCVEEEAVNYAIKKGILSGVGSDVLERELENFKKSPLYQYAKKNPQANIIITPHIGGATIDAWKKVFSVVCKHILQADPYAKK
jgi:D-3-phosphoglycerate dehydrogenase